MASDAQDRKPFPWKKILWWTLGIVATLSVLFGIFLFIVWLIHPKFVYAPVSYKRIKEDDLLRKPEIASLAPQKVDLAASDGTRLRGYWVAHEKRPDNPREKLITMLYLHGNEGDIEKNFELISEWRRKMPVNILMLSYRGFGYSSGKPSMKGITKDSQAALDYLHHRPDVDPLRLMVYGHSLGGAVALRLVGDNPGSFSVIVIENTFLSIRKMSSHRAPALAWVSFVVTEKWDNEEQVRRLMAYAQSRKGRIPSIGFIMGKKDRVVPPSHMEALFKELQEIPKIDPSVIVQKLEYPTCNHACFRQATYFDDLTRFYYAATHDPIVL